MAYKLSFLLSLFFVIEVVAYGGDLAAVSLIHTSLDAASVTASYRISLEQTLSNETIEMVKKECGGVIEQVGEGGNRFGDEFTFTIYRYYSPLILSSSSMRVSVTRSALIGYLAS
jgi:hypothetical protein